MAKENTKFYLVNKPSSSFMGELKEDLSQYTMRYISDLDDSLRLNSKKKIVQKVIAETFKRIKNLESTTIHESMRYALEYVIDRWKRDIGFFKRRELYSAKFLHFISWFDSLKKTNKKLYFRLQKKLKKELSVKQWNILSSLLAPKSVVRLYNQKFRVSKETLTYKMLGKLYGWENPIIISHEGKKIQHITCSLLEKEKF